MINFQFEVYDGKGTLEEGETAEARFIKIQAAYELLIDGERRRQYDMDNRVNPMKVRYAILWNRTLLGNWVYLDVHFPSYVSSPFFSPSENLLWNKLDCSPSFYSLSATLLELHFLFLNPFFQASQAWMEWLIKKRKAWDQRGDMAVSAWAEQQQRELNLRVRRLSRSKVTNYFRNFSNNINVPGWTF